MGELEEIAIERSAALGRAVIVTAWTGSDRCQIVDLDDSGEIVDVIQGVRLAAPAPGSEGDAED